MTSVLLSILLLAASPALGAVAPTRLRCEYRVDPLGIDVERPRLSWVVSSKERGQVQTAYQIIAASSESGLASGSGDLWDSGKVLSDQSAHVPYAGKPLRSGARVRWKVRIWDGPGEASAWSEPATFQMGILDAAEWKARWIGAELDSSRAAQPSPHLRKTFHVPGPVRRATAHASALGLYELRLNGRRVGNQVLAPEFTNYRRRVQYQTYDVTDLLRRGENAAGAILGEGWYAGRVGLSSIVPGGPSRGIYGPRPLFLLQLEVELEDGARFLLVTDESWKVTVDGPVRSACILDGEVHDARKALAGWDLPGYDDGAWKSAAIEEIAEKEISARLVAQPNEPIVVVEERKPIALHEPSPGTFVFDFGQNLVGWCRVKARGPAGSEIVLRHAEVLSPDGNIYTANLRGAAQTDRFILGGSGEEVFEPRFTYHGFRHVEARGFPARPSLDSITACVVHSSSPPALTFDCSDPLVARLVQNIDWTLRGNLHSMPTDCPQRDERLGWMGDAQVFSQTACFHRDMAAFFTKWLRDVRDDQAADGRYPDFAPHPYKPDERFSGTPAWGDGGVIIPWRAYVNYGDRRLLEEHFESAKRWIDHVRSQAPQLLWTGNRGNDYNDWLNGNTLVLEGWPRTGAEVPKEVFATAFFAHSTEIVAKMAAALGRGEDAKRYGDLAKDIKSAFCRAFLKTGGRLLGDTQAGYALALHFDILPEDLREAAAEHMIQGIKAYKGHHSTGIQSTIRLLLELTRSGHNEAAYQVLLNRTPPSWLYMIEQGGTTIWERWDGYVGGRGFQDAGMNSFNHYAFGSIGEWICRVVLGINPDEDRPGFEHFTLRPLPGGGLTWARGSHDSIRGKISSEWKVDADSAVFGFTIPANSSATVHIPAGPDASIAESGGPAETARGVKLLRKERDAAVYEIGSGSYEFTVRGRPVPAKDGGASRGAIGRETIDRETLDRWAAPFRGWHYNPDFVLPPSPPDGLGFQSIDCPLVWKLGAEWQMWYTGFDGRGYQTALATSDDLVHWTPKGLAMSFGKPGAYDHGGVTFGGLLLESYDLKAPRTPKRWPDRDGKYWVLYGCYPKQGGYEIRPGAEGVAWSTDGITWHRTSEDKPILSIEGAAEWEKDCIYQPWLLEHGGEFWNFYNAANGGIEQTGFATSTDMLRWTRYPGNPVIRNGGPGSYDEQFCSDGKVFRDGDHWVMFYFGVGRGGAHIMAAFSRDLVHWTSHPEPLYKAGGHPAGLDKQYAHKISLVYDDAKDIFYMYYCAVGPRGRGIGLLTSSPLK